MRVVAEPIDMIAVFHGKPGSHPEPYRFRFVDRYGDQVVVKVDRVLSVELLKIGGIDTYNYTCQSMIRDIMRMYVLKYVISQARWELYKI